METSPEELRSWPATRLRAERPVPTERLRVVDVAGMLSLKQVNETETGAESVRVVMPSPGTGAHFNMVRNSL